MAFPLSPANNQTALVNGIVYQWNNTLGVWKRNGSLTSITAGQILLNSAQQSTTNGSGSLIVSGGAGITGNVYTGGIFITGAANGITFADGSTQTTGATGIDQTARTTANNASSNTIVIQGVDTAQNTRMTLIEGINTDQNTRITIAEGVDVGQNTRISIIEGVDTAQNTRMTIADGVNTTQNTNITAANTKAQAAFDKANTAPKTTTSASAPVSPTVGDMWYDTDNDVLLRYTNDGTSNNWIDITGPIIRSNYVRPTYLITANAS
jgi:hypothetical protein